MARGTKPVPIQDLLNTLFDSSQAIDSTKAGAVKITPVDGAGAEITSTKAGAIKVVPVDSAGTILDISSETISSSAARTATFNTGDQLNRSHIGAYIFLDINEADSSVSLIFNIQAKVPTGGSYVNIYTGSSFLASTGGEVKTYLVAPGSDTKAVGAGITGIAPFPLPRTWRASVTHANAQSVDYSIESYRIP